MSRSTHARCAVGMLSIAAIGTLAQVAAAQSPAQSVPLPGVTATPATPSSPPAAAAGPAGPVPESKPQSPPQSPTEIHPPVPMHALSEAVTLESGATCLDADRLIRRVARWLGRDQVEMPIRVSVHGSAARANSVSFVIDRGAGDRAERSISDGPTDCDQLHSAVALSIALAIDATDPNSQGGALSSDDIPDDETLLQTPEKAEPPYFRLAAGLFGFATSGVLTDVAGAGAVRVEVGLVRWLDLRAGALTMAVGDQSIAGAALDTAWFDASLTGAYLEACPAFNAAPKFRALACAGTMAGSFRTAGHGPGISASSQASAWLALTGGFEAQAELASRLALAVSVDLAVPLIGHRIELLATDGSAAGDPRVLLPVGVLVGVGLVFRIL